ncbi:MAG TPA: YetF domain-containing protein [Gaiellaceae bacterium]
MWQHIWDLHLSVGEKVLRSILIYTFLVVALRIVGKRELGQTNTLDLVVLLLVANAVQNGIIGNDVSVTGAFIGAAVLFGINETLNRITYQFPWAERAVEGEPAKLIENGRPLSRALLRAGISLTELLAIARRQGFPDLGSVQTAILETNGVVSMFRKGESPGELHPAEPGGIKLGKRRRARR